MPVMIDVSKRFLDMGKAAYRDILFGLEASRDMDKILDSHIDDPCLPEAVATRFCKMAFDFGACVTSSMRGDDGSCPPYRIILCEGIEASYSLGNKYGSILPWVVI